jgi:pilus assembly protein CpaC
MNLIKILLSFSLIFSFSFSMELVQKDMNDKAFSVSKGSFKVLEFEKMVKNIKVSSEENIEIDFLDDNTKPLKAIKIFAKEIGTGNILITFVDSSTMHVNINIVENLADIIKVAQQIAPNLEIMQSNGKVILKGKIQDQKTKNTIIDLFKKANVEIDKDLIDLINVENPEKMIRIKLYAVEVNNNKGLTLKNNWFVSSKNYMEVKTPDGYYNKPLNSYGADYQASSFKEVTDKNGVTSIVPSSWATVSNDKNSQANNQRNTLVNGAIDQIMSNAVSLTGGLTGAANYLGKYFNAGLTLNYLASEGVASILDETTLLTLEKQDATFHAGGTIYLKIATTTNQGVPTTEVRNINYGLQLDIKAENIINDNFVNLSISTKSTQIDWVNTVDGIPSFTEKSIKTNVVVDNLYHLKNKLIFQCLFNLLLNPIPIS